MYAAAAAASRACCGPHAICTETLSLGGWQTQQQHVDRFGTTCSCWPCWLPVANAGLRVLSSSLNQHRSHRCRPDLMVTSHIFFLKDHQSSRRQSQHNQNVPRASLGSKHLPRFVQGDHRFKPNNPAHTVCATSHVMFTSAASVLLLLPSLLQATSCPKLQQSLLLCAWHEAMRAAGAVLSGPSAHTARSTTHN